MIDGINAVKKFREAYPDLSIVKAAVYDKAYYLFEAVEDTNKVDYNSPFYLMEGKTGDILPFTPTMDILGFHEAFREHQIRIDGG